MSDIKDIMGVSRQGMVVEKQEKVKKAKIKKPKGMSREAFALMSASHPLMPSQLMGEIEKEKEETEKVERRGKISYEWRPFKNPCRSDDLELYHWVKCYTNTATNTKIIPSEQEYPFLKYNKRCPVMRYNNEEWENLIAKDDDWSKEETDYALDLVELLDMRWFAVADRYDFKGGKKRGLDDIKGRYYSVARQLLIGREGGTTGIANNVLVKTPFDPMHEKRRKAGFEQYLLRSADKDAEEEAILAQAAKIEAKRKAEESKAKKGGAAAGAPSAADRIQEQMIEISEFEATPEVGTPPLFDANGTPVLPAADASGNIPRVLMRSLHTKDVVDAQIAALSDKQKDLLSRVLTGIKLSEFPRAANRAVCGAYITLIKEALEYIEVRKSIEAGQFIRKRIKPEDDDFNGDHGDEKRQKISIKM